VDGVIEDAGRADAGAFLARLLRLDARAFVRLRPVEPEVAEIWAMLPFQVLVARRLRTPIESDITVTASELMRTLSDPAAPVPDRRDQAWRWPLPPSAGTAVEKLPEAEVARVAAAASRTLRQAVSTGVGGRPVGERLVRDALLDHVPIVVTAGPDTRIDVPQRLVQGVVRMGFLRVTSPQRPDAVASGNALVTVRLSGSWIGLDASYGCGWYRPGISLSLR
jgi:hypothetical protein